jgi:hypothetical protein
VFAITSRWLVWTKLSVGTASDDRRRLRVFLTVHDNGCCQGGWNSLDEFINIPTAEHDMSEHDMSEHDLHNLSYHLGPEYCVSGDPSVGSAAIFRVISQFLAGSRFF